MPLASWKWFPLNWSHGFVSLMRTWRQYLWHRNLRAHFPIGDCSNFTKVSNCEYSRMGVPSGGANAAWSWCFGGFGESRRLDPFALCRTLWTCQSRQAPGFQFRFFDIQFFVVTFWHFADTVGCHVVYSAWARQQTTWNGYVFLGIFVCKVSSQCIHVYWFLSWYPMHLELLSKEV